MKKPCHTTSRLRRLPHNNLSERLMKRLCARPERLQNIGLYQAGYYGTGIFLVGPVLLPMFDVMTQASPNVCPLLP